MNLETILEVDSQIEIKSFDKNSYLLINNKNGKYIKISGSFIKFIQLFDGQKTVQQVFTTYNENSLQKLSEERFLIIVESLNKIGIFTNSETFEHRRKLPPYLSYGFVFLKGDWIGKIINHFHFLFNKKLAILLVLFCICFLSYIFYRNLLHHQTFNFLHILPLYIVILFISTIFHELGHCTATNFYKAKHGGIGFGFYLYFIPVFFADVTDIWRLDKWKRIVINSSGVYFEILFYVVLSIFSLLLNSNSLFVIVSFLSLKTLYNLLPYFRMDGYWILSDLIEQPNLMSHSFERTKKLILFNSKDFNTRDYFLAVYGVFNLGLMTYFIGFMIIFYSQEIISFPKNILIFISNLNVSSFTWNVSQISKQFPVLLFYFFSIRILTGLIKKNFNINQN